jgi:transposase-like protein
MRLNKSKANLAKSEVVEEIPLACSNENVAVEFFEAKLWKGQPVCAKCDSPHVYKMIDAKTGQRNKRFLWRCHDCKSQFTVRIGTVLEESRIPLRHWAYAFWRAATSKKGVSALEIKRHTQLSYRSALFLMHRIRFAMTPERGTLPKLKGIVECDETYIGGKPRVKNNHGHGTGKEYWKSKKVAVFGMVERDGIIRRQVLANVSAKNLKRVIRAGVDKSATLSTDSLPAYKSIGRDFARHIIVNHNIREYVRGDASTNMAESSFAVLKRGLHGIYHSVSKKHLHRYISEFDFRWNTRKLNDGDRTVQAIEGAAGKRLDYKKLTE